MSKIAALAAKRRQKENQKLNQQAPKPESPAPGSYAASLDRLRLGNASNQPMVLVNETSPTPDQESTIKGIKRLKLSAAKQEPAQVATSALPPPATPPEMTRPQTPPPSDPVPAPGIGGRGQPSAFAGVLMSSSPQQSSVNQLPDSLMDTALYENFLHSEAASFDFTGPSPDDVVINAQKSKGSQH